MSFSSFGILSTCYLLIKWNGQGACFHFSKDEKNALKLLGSQNSQRVKCYKVFEARPWLLSVLFDNAPSRHHHALALAGSTLAHPRTFAYDTITHALLRHPLHLNSLPTAPLITTVYIYLSFKNLTALQSYVYTYTNSINCKLHKNKHFIYAVPAYSNEDVNLFCKTLLESRSIVISISC